MRSKVSIGLSGAMLVTATLLSGCGTTQVSERNLPPPAVELGPQFEILKASRGTYKVSEVMDSTHRAHLVVAVSDSEEVRHLVIGPDGLLSSEVIRAGASPASLDLAFDGKGNLHALIDDEHLMQKDGKWIGSLRTPWKEANLNPYGAGGNLLAAAGPGFVKGAPDLIWTFNVQGWEMGLSKRMMQHVIIGSGWNGAPIATPIPEPIIIPYQTSKLLVVPEETPYRHWNAVGMESNLDVGEANVSIDGRNNLNVVYMANNRVFRVELRHSAFRADKDCSETHQGNAAPTADKDTGEQTQALKLLNGSAVCPVSGSPLLAEAPPAFQSKVALPSLPEFVVPPLFYLWQGHPITPENVATDPESGTILLASHGVSSLVGGDKSRPKDPVEMPLSNVDVLLAPASKGRFHALALGTRMESSVINPVYYLAYAHGAWSAPMEIGKFSKKLRPVEIIEEPFREWRGKSPGFDKIPKYLVPKIVPDNNGRALLIWPTDDALVGRWVALK